MDGNPNHKATVMELVVAEEMDVISSKIVQANATQVVVIFITQCDWIRCLKIKIVISCYFITYYKFLPSLQRDRPEHPSSSWFPRFTSNVFILQWLSREWSFCWKTVLLYPKRLHHQQQMLIYIKNRNNKNNKIAWSPWAMKSLVSVCEIIYDTTLININSQNLSRSLNI